VLILKIIIVAVLVIFACWLPPVDTPPDRWQ